MSEPYKLELVERPCINGLLLDTIAARIAAEHAGQFARAGLHAARENVLRRLLAAFPV